MPNYANTYLGQAPGDLDEQRKKKLQALFQGGMQGPQDSLLAGQDIGLKKSVFGGAKPPPQMFDSSQHSAAMAGAAQENPYAGFMKGVGGFAAGMQGETPAAGTKKPEDISNDDRATPEERGETTPRPTMPVPEQGAGGVGPVPLGGPNAPKGNSTAIPLGGGTPDAYKDVMRSPDSISNDDRAMESQPPAPGPGTPQGVDMSNDDRAMESQTGRTLPMGTEEPKPVLKGSRKTLADIEAAKNAPAKEEPKWWKRFGRGAQEALQKWNAAGQPGGGQGALGALLGGGVGGARDKKGQAEATKQGGINKLWKKYGEEMEFEKGETQKSKAELDLQREQSKPAMEAAYQDKVITKAESERLKKEYNLDIPPTDARTIDKEERGGTTYLGHTSGEGAGVYQPSGSLPIKREQEDYEVTLPSGKKVFLKPGQAASTEVGIAQANAGRAATAKNQQRTQAIAGDVRRSEAKQKVAGAQAEIARLEKSKTDALAQDPDADVTGIEAKIAAAEKDVAAGRLGSLPTYDEALDYLVSGKGKKKYELEDAKRRLKNGQGKFYQ